MIFSTYKEMKYKNFHTSFACDGINHAFWTDKISIYAHKICYATPVANGILRPCDGSCKGLKHERYGFMFEEIETPIDS